MTDIADTIRDEFPRKRIAIAGDLVADQFLHGSISRVSREAPVFILRHQNTETRPGAAANAAANVASLGATPVLVGVIGRDTNGELLAESLASSGVDKSFVIAETSLSTTTKVRVLAGHQHSVRQQVIRIDYENTAGISETVRRRLHENFIEAAGTADAIIISDYNYGVADSGLYNAARRISNERKIPLLIDSRSRLREFAGATSATPNQEEVEEMIGSGFSSDDCGRLCRELNFESLLVTCGNKGMIVVDRNGVLLDLPVVGSSEPVDVTGAGDTVIAAYSLGLASGLSCTQAAVIANHAGGIVVMKKGTAVVFAGELLDSLAAAPQLARSDSAA
jgi:rfaE bifunctional protein kinase chain/domain